MPRGFKVTLVLLALMTTGCYHQVVHTGLSPAPGNAVIEKTAAIYFFGLAGAEVDVSQDCPSGVAVIETQQTFMNGLLGGITLGIYTPRSVTVTCASDPGGVPDAASVTIAAGASADQVLEANRRAMELAWQSRGPVVLRRLQ